MLSHASLFMPCQLWVPRSGNPSSVSKTVGSSSVHGSQPYFCSEGARNWSCQPPDSLWCSMMFPCCLLKSKTSIRCFCCWGRSRLTETQIAISCQQPTSEFAQSLPRRPKAFHLVHLKEHHQGPSLEKGLKPGAGGGLELLHSPFTRPESTSINQNCTSQTWLVQFQLLILTWRRWQIAGAKQPAPLAYQMVSLALNVRASWTTDLNSSHVLPLQSFQVRLILILQWFAENCSWQQVWVHLAFWSRVSQVLVLSPNSFGYMHHGTWFLLLQIDDVGMGRPLRPMMDVRSPRYSPARSCK